MLEILFSWLSPFRFIGIWIDTIAYSLIDNAYNLIVTFSKGTLLKEEFIVSLMNNLYVVIGIFALFRIAMLLVNSIINPDKLSEKGNGLANVFGNFIIMFVMLVMTPFVFREAINLQTVIVDGNYIQKLFIKGDAMEGKNPGKAMRSIAIGSLITLDEVALEQCEGGGTCSNNAKEAIEAYRDMEKNGFSFPTLSKYIGVSIKDDDTGEVVYVYNYMFIVTFAAGIFIAYVLFSFGIDIAVRMVELTVLQILAPLFIATYIDPKSAKSGTFHKWLTTVGKTYASLFIKLAILSLMLLLISIVSNLDYYGSNLDLSGFEKLVLLFAILIFAKKAPKWIGDMVGVEGAGLGLYTPKKLRENMAGYNTMKRAAGVSAAVIGNRVANARRQHALKKETGDYNKLGLMKKDKKRDLRKNGITDKDGNLLKGRKAVSYYKKDHGISAGNKFVRNATGLKDGISTGLKVTGDAKGIISSIKSGIGVSGKYNEKYTQNQPGAFEKVSEKVTNKLDKYETSAYGSAADRYEAADKMKKVKTRKQYFGSENYEKYGDDLIGGMGEFSKAITDKNGHIADDIYDRDAMLWARLNGWSAEYKGGKLEITNNVGGLEDVGQAAKNFSALKTSSGAAHIDEMYNKKQNSAMTEYTSNQDALNKSNQNYTAAKDNINSILGPLGMMDPKTGALQITGVGGSGIKIDSADLKSGLKGLETTTEKDYQKATTDYNNAIVAHNNQKMTDEEFSKATSRYNEETLRYNGIKNIINHSEMINSQYGIMGQEQKNINSLIQRNGILQSTINSIGAEWEAPDGTKVGKYDAGASMLPNSYVTNSQKTEKLALDADKISKEIAGIDAKEESGEKK